MKFGVWGDIIRSVKTPLSLLALIILGVCWLLYKYSSGPVAWTSLGILCFVTIFCVLYIAKDKTLFPAEIKSIWSKSDLPLDPEQRGAWLGKWNCKWTYRTKENKILPYVDDIIEIQDVDIDTGELVGIGHSSYIEGGNYFLRGRVSNKSLAHVFYTSPAETAGLSGMVILSRPPIGDITGWWLGAGRKGGDIGGGVTLEKHDKNPNFEIKNYKVI